MKEERGVGSLTREAHVNRDCLKEEGKEKCTVGCKRRKRREISV